MSQHAPPRSSSAVHRRNSRAAHSPSASARVTASPSNAPVIGALYAAPRATRAEHTATAHPSPLLWQHWMAATLLCCWHCEYTGASRHALTMKCGGSTRRACDPIGITGSARSLAAPTVPTSRVHALRRRALAVPTAERHVEKALADNARERQLHSHTDGRALGGARAKQWYAGRPLGPLGDMACAAALAQAECRRLRWRAPAPAPIRAERAH